LHFSFHLHFTCISFHLNFSSAFFTCIFLLLIDICHLGWKVGHQSIGDALWYDGQSDSDASDLGSLL
jgi:hypothetical protein